MEPYEIIMAPFLVYKAPLDETFPDVDAVPGGNWVAIGTNGLGNLSDDGVSVSHEQTLVKKRNSGGTGPIKVVRTEEELIITLTLEDVSIETYAKILNDQTLTDTAADADDAGFRYIRLHQGSTVETFSLLIRGDASAYGSSFKTQYEIPVAYQSGNPKPVFKKGASADLQVEFTVLEDPDAATEATRFGTLRMQDAAATG